MAPRDFAALVSEFGGRVEPIPSIVRLTPAPLAEGDARRFWLGDSDTSRNYQITATLGLLSRYTQMWVQEGVEVERDALAASARAFDEHTYPMLREAFGAEWSPGIDGDPRIAVLNARFSGAIGYFYSANEYSHLANPYSNEAEMVFMNVDALTPGTGAYNAVLAHEFQHMIHWHVDGNEDSWLNEGASELAEVLTGYGSDSGTVAAFAADPDVQLNAWGEEGVDVGAHYGASYLMMRYILERFGADALRDVIQNPANGIPSVEGVLAERGEGLTFRDLFADWTVANALDRPDIADGRYGYRGTDLNAQPFARLDVGASGRSPQLVGTVAQHGSDYIAIAPPPQGGRIRLAFEGQSTVRLVPNAPAGGRYQWWSNRGDSSHSSLEHTLDLTGVTSATLTFDLWYDIEVGWDYAYVRASADGGETWDVLRGTHMSAYNPNGNALATGYTGVSGADPEKGDVGAEPTWVREEIDLTPYAGESVLVRFDYVTDDAVNNAGLCLDNLEVRAIGWSDDAERGEDGWRAVGFLRHDNVLPQDWIMSLLVPGDEPRVERLEVGPDGRGEWLLPEVDEGSDDMILAISALAPSTTERAEYSVTVAQERG
jgi:immune inhibitor A